MRSGWLDGAERGLHHALAGVIVGPSLAVDRCDPLDDRDRGQHPGPAAVILDLERRKQRGRPDDLRLANPVGGLAAGVIFHDLVVALDGRGEMGAGAVRQIAGHRRGTSEPAFDLDQAAGRKLGDIARPRGLGGAHQRHIVALRPPAPQQKGRAGREDNASQHQPRHHRPLPTPAKSFGLKRTISCSARWLRGNLPICTPTFLGGSAWSQQRHNLPFT